MAEDSEAAARPHEVGLQRVQVAHRVQEQPGHLLELRVGRLLLEDVEQARRDVRLKIKKTEASLRMQR